MKKILVLIGMGFLVIQPGCSNEKERYVDLRSGETITVEKDAETGLWVNAETRKPVYIYVDNQKKDTIYGRTGASIKGQVVKTDDGVWWYTGDDEYKSKYDGVKLKADNGEYKIKEGDYKKKVEEDGDIKIKDGDRKIKVDGETGERKVKND